MALIVPVRGFTPQIGKDCFLAENATIVGDTVIGDGCSIWFNAVLRGDVNWIKIGNHVNIQDGSVLHTLYEKSTITIGDYVSVGHNVTIHGADVHDYALIGMGSTLLDGVVVGEGAIVAAGSLVLKNTQIGPYEVWGGVPAKFIKKADPEDCAQLRYVRFLVHARRRECLSSCHARSGNNFPICQASKSNLQNVYPFCNKRYCWGRSIGNRLIRAISFILN